MGFSASWNYFYRNKVYANVGDKTFLSGRKNSNKKIIIKHHGGINLPQKVGPFFIAITHQKTNFNTVFSFDETSVENSFRTFYSPPVDQSSQGFSSKLGPIGRAGLILFLRFIWQKICLVTNESSPLLSDSCLPAD